MEREFGEGGKEIGSLGVGTIYTLLVKVYVQVFDKEFIGAKLAHLTNIN